MKHFTLPQNITTYIINNVTCHQFKENKKLEWQRFTKKYPIEWKDSKITAKQLKLNGSSWKLPNLNELKSLVNINYNFYQHEYYRSSINFICFGFCFDEDFWSSSFLTNCCLGDVQGVNFGRGFDDVFYELDELYTRCVR